jgi:putative peptidoglycan lipid II flippase
VTPPGPDRDTSEVRTSRRKSLGRTSLRVSILAGLALVAGFGVEAVVAALFGAGTETDSFFIAATIPFALAAVLVAVANQALVPLFVTWYRDSGSEAPRNVGGMVGSMFIMAVGVFIFGVALSPIIPRIIAPGASDATQHLASELSVILFATVITRTIGESLRALLNARFSFAIPAASPLLISAGTVSVMLVMWDDIGIRSLAYGYLVGGVLQVALLAATTIRKRVPIRLGVGFGRSEVRAGLRLLGWPTASNSLNILARIAERFIASFLGPGAITIMNYAWRIINAIGGTVFFRSVTVVLIPNLAASKGRRDDQISTVMTGLRIMLLVSIPIASFLAVFSSDIVRILFERGAFTSEDARTLAAVLTVYAFSLPFIALTRVLLATMYARLDMKRPFFNRALLTAVDIVGAMALAPIFGVTGIAAGFVIAVGAAFAQAVFLVKPLAIPWKRLVRPAVCISVATGVAVVVALVVHALVTPGTGTIGVTLQLIVSTGAGLAVYALLVLRLGRARCAVVGGRR